MPARKRPAEKQRAATPPPPAARDVDRFTGEGGANPPPASRPEDLGRVAAPRSARDPARRPTAPR